MTEGSMVHISDKRHKDTLTISITPYLKSRAQDLVKTGNFSSLSDVFTIALSNFLALYDERTKTGKIIDKEELLIHEGKGQSYGLIVKEKECISEALALNARSPTGTTLA